MSRIWPTSRVITFSAQRDYCYSRMQIADVTHMHTSGLQVRRFSVSCSGVWIRDQARSWGCQLSVLEEYLMSLLWWIAGDGFVSCWVGKISPNMLAVFVIYLSMQHLDAIIFSTSKVRKNAIIKSRNLFVCFCMITIQR